MNDFKKTLSDEQNRRNEIMTTITDFYKGEKTEEIQKKILEIDEELIKGSTMFYALLRIAKEYIETGKVQDEETFAEYMKGKLTEVNFGIEVGDEWKKDPSEWGKGEKDER